MAEIAFELYGEGFQHLAIFVIPNGLLANQCILAQIHTLCATLNKEGKQTFINFKSCCSMDIFESWVSRVRSLRVPLAWNKWKPLIEIPGENKWEHVFFEAKRYLSVEPGVLRTGLQCSGF